jgi:hypothetical protein
MTARRVSIQPGDAKRLPERIDGEGIAERIADRPESLDLGGCGFGVDRLRLVGERRRQLLGDPLQVPDGVAHHALDLLLGTKAQQVGTRAGDARDVGERQHADIGLGRDRADRGNRLVEQGAENDLRPLVDHLLGGLAGTHGRAAGVPGQQHQVVGADVEQRHLGSLKHVLAEIGGASRQR